MEQKSAYFKGNVLVVDDSQTALLDMRSKLSNFVSRENIYMAQNYFEAIDLLNNHEFGIAFVDLQMPQKTGMDLILDVFQTNPKTKNIPVVVTTGVESDSLITQSLKNLTYRYFQKPITIKQITDAFENMPTRNNVEEIIKPINEKSNVTNETNWQVFPIFLREMDACLSDLKHSIETHNIDQSRKLLHQMIGAASIVGKKQVETLLINIQVLVKSNAPNEECLHLLNELEKQLDDTFQFLMTKRTSYSIHFFDDQEIVINQVKELLQEDYQMDNVEVSTTLEECLAKLESNETDILIADYLVKKTPINMLAELVLSQLSDSPILAFTLEPDQEIKALKKQCENLSGYVNKSWGLEELVRALKTVSNGREYWPELK